MAEVLNDLVVDTTSEREGEADIILKGTWGVQEVSLFQDDQKLSAPDAGEQTRIRIVKTTTA